MPDIGAWIMSVVAAVYPGINPPAPYLYDGYVEDDFVYASASASGRIETIMVAEGQAIQIGDLLFTLEDKQSKAALHTAEAQLAQARAELDNLQTGSREAETEVVRASLRQARVALDIARTRLARSDALFERGNIPQATVDDQRAAVDQAEAQVAQLQAELAVAELPARDAQRKAAEAAVEAAGAQVELAQSNLGDRKVFAPVTGKIDKVFYERGEVAAAGAPVISLLQSGSLTALFFVPQQERAELMPGETVTISCDGCPTGMTAQITRLASDPQYTPPILYTRDDRGRLVYRVEAEIRNPEGVLPGQPITVDAANAAGK